MSAQDRTAPPALERLLAAVDRAPVLVHAKNRELRYTWANRTFELAHGLEHGAALGLREEDLPGRVGPAASRADELRVIERGVTITREDDVTGPDGVVTYLTQTFPLRAADGEVHALCGIAADITDRKRAEGARQRRGEQQALLSLFATEAIEQEAQEVAERAVQIAAGGLWLEKVALLDAPPAGESSALVVPIIGAHGISGALVVEEDDAAALDADDRHFLDGVARVLAGARERDRARGLEAELARSRRLEAVGKLAGGVAHDFNNLLAVIINYAAFVEEELDPGAAGLRADLGEITKAAQRAAELTHELLVFSRQEGLAQSALDANAAISRAEPALAQALGSDVVLTTALSAELGRVTIDDDDLQRILRDLVGNSRDAMPQGGTVAVQTAQVELAADARGEGGMAAGRYARITVSDTGDGMTSEVLDRALDPFFTTKPVGEGIGLGLATVYGTVRRAGGRLQLDASPGRGTTVTIDLPVDRGEAAHDGDGAELPGAGLTVLLVEADTGPRQILKAVLEDVGYRVLAAADVDEAAAGWPGEDVDLVLADRAVPVPGGARLIVMAPSAEAAGREREALGAGVALIVKPFGREELLSAAAAVLGRRA